jgi:pyridoxine/pyridoxamine 5'-phosphate oxidase
MQAASLEKFKDRDSQVSLRDIYKLFHAQLRSAQNGQLSEAIFWTVFNYDERGAGSLRAAIIIALDSEGARYRLKLH